MTKFEIPEKVGLEDERLVDLDDDFQDPPPKQLNERSKKKQKVDSSTITVKKSVVRVKKSVFNPIQTRQSTASKMKNAKQTTRIIFSPMQSNQRSPAEEEVVTSKKVFDEFRDQTNKENVGLSSKSLLHGKVDLGTMEKIMKPPKIQEQTTNEQREEPIWPDSQNTIPDELLPSLNVYSSKSIIIDPSANRELQTPQIDFCFYYLRKKSKYEPNSSYKYNTVDCNLMNIIRSVMDVYSVDDQNLNVGGQEAHLNKYINEFRMYTAVP
ncbi:hypothetical protein FXO37_10537 [Capsicum annuum]|nr:hypothetical protein FXO37_10537 [Capsicum annuum]